MEEAISHVSWVTPSLPSSRWYITVSPAGGGIGPSSFPESPPHLSRVLSTNTLGYCGCGSCGGCSSGGGGCSSDCDGCNSCTSCRCYWVGCCSSCCPCCFGCCGDCCSCPRGLLPRPHLQQQLVWPWLQEGLLPAEELLPEAVLFLGGWPACFKGRRCWELLSAVSEAFLHLSCLLLPRAVTCISWD